MTVGSIQISEDSVSCAMHTNSNSPYCPPRTTVSCSTKEFRDTKRPCQERDALVEFALRDDCDPHAFFLSETRFSFPFSLTFLLVSSATATGTSSLGGLFNMLSRSRKGIFGLLHVTTKLVFLRDELKIAIEELEAAKSQAYLKRGTPAA